MEAFELAVPLGTVRGLRAGTPGATPVLALHGWLDNAASFIPLAPHFDALDLRAVDLPGHGASDHLAQGADYSFAGAVHSVLDIADALGWARFALLGHSMGAGIASLVAAACPERVTRLVAIEALGALADTPENTVDRLRQAVTAQMMRVELVREAAEAPPPETPQTIGHHLDATTGEDDFGEGGVATLVRQEAQVVAPEDRDPNDPGSWGKVGRNEPCPCGSGKKYKHCHGTFA